MKKQSSQLEAHSSKLTKEHPILFSTPMVQAILEGRKTQTRRVIKAPILEEFAKKGIELSDIGHEIYNYEGYARYGQPGDLLWVRETVKLGAWRKDGRMAFDYKASPEIRKTQWVEFEDDPVGEKFTKLWVSATDELLKKGVKPDENGMYSWEPGKSPLKWKPSIHMFKAAARLWLEVEEIRVERVQNISDEDIIAEGVRIPVNGPKNVVFILGKENNAISFLPQIDIDKGERWNQHQLLFAHWAELWCKVNGRKSWNANPWVWVVSFKELSRTGKPSFDSAQDDNNFAQDDKLLTSKI